jgi:hypothetical protein
VKHEADACQSSNKALSIAVSNTGIIFISPSAEQEIDVGIGKKYS